jgi:imidazolonepropionase
VKDLLLEHCGPIVSPHPHEAYRLEILPGDTMVVRQGKVSWVGHASAPEARAARAGQLPTLDAVGAMVLPGFVDSHTQPVFFEHRAGEYEMRNAGRPYLEIQAAGGGILSSRRSLMEADPAELKERVRQRLRRFLELGTTTIEAKSGYGLSVEHELLSLGILRELAAEEALRHGLAEAMDAFCEPGVISVEETEDLFRAAKASGLALRLHADQIRHGGGALLAARMCALSADHLEQATDEDIQALVRAGCSFGLLPGCTYFLGLDDWPPARRIIQAGGRIALATDFNPGSSHLQSMPFVLSLATCRLKMTAEEALWSATMGGAISLGQGSRVACLRPGWQADFCLWPFREVEELPYHAGDNRPLRVVKCGLPVV